VKQTDILMIPGPTPLPDAVREVMSRPAIGHRSAEFKTVLKRVLPRLQWIFQTKSDVFLYTASGTGAMEASIINTLNPGDTVLALVCGVFSARWAEVAETLGITVERLTVPAGEPNLAEPLQQRLAQDSGKTIKAVMFTHSETSTGVLSPVQQLAQIIRDHGALSIVDAVTSMGATDVPVDDWGLDLVISGSQKGFMIPPGLSFLSVSERAWAAHKQCKQPGYYFNFTKYKKAQDDFTTPYTPATHLILGLDAALEMMEIEGLQAIFERHHRLRDMTRAGVRAMGLECLVKDDAYASTAATAVIPPDGVSVAQIRQGLKERFGIVVADGQKELKGKIFRIGHLGHVGEREVFMVLAALEAVLIQHGVAIESGTAIAAAQGVALHRRQEDSALVS
jgi:aspartate aminotransferase-like enzyme